MFITLKTEEYGEDGKTQHGKEIAMLSVEKGYNINLCDNLCNMLIKLNNKCIFCHFVQLKMNILIRL